VKVVVTVSLGDFLKRKKEKEFCWHWCWQAGLLLGRPVVTFGI
jgi:hypothetical protein